MYELNDEDIADPYRSSPDAASLSVPAAIVSFMASPAPLPPGEPVPPAADPLAIRACLTPTLASEFDNEWAIVLDRVKQTKDLAEVHELLTKWRHIAYGEMKDPGSYFRLLAKAELIERTGRHPDALPIEDMRELIRQRLGQ